MRRRETYTGLAAQSYGYDDQGRRVSKTVGASTTNYLYNGQNILAEYASWGSPSAQYTYGPGTDDPILRAGATKTQYFHKDGMGSVVAVSDSNGEGAAQWLDPWGIQWDSIGSIPTYGYTGREPDETGLIYYRARYYDPTFGRFTQRDPVGLTGGINQYAYVGGNPTNRTDPSGTIFEPISPNTATAQTGYAGQSQAGLTAGEQSLASAQGDSGAYTLSELNLAKDSQVKGGYAPDKWTLGTLEKGSIVYGGLPGPTNFYTDFSTIKASGLSATELFDSLQVKPHEIKGYRDQVGAYRVLETIDVPQGIVTANPDAGAGGGKQFWINEFEDRLELIRVFNLTN